MGLKDAADVVSQFQRPDGHYNREEFWVVLDLVSRWHHVEITELFDEVIRRQQVGWGRIKPSSMLSF